MWKQVWGSVVVTIGLAMVPAAVYADSGTVIGQQIVVRGVILPARYIVVSLADPSTIVEIMSNSSESPEPSVYVGSITGPNIPLSSSLKEHYQKIMNAHPNFTIGTLNVSEQSIPRERPSLIVKARNIAMPLPALRGGTALAFWHLPQGTFGRQLKL